MLKKERKKEKERERGGGGYMYLCILQWCLLCAFALILQIPFLLVTT